MEQVALTEKGSAVFVDGVNFNHVKRAIGIDHLDWNAFYRILLEKVCTTGRFVCEPVITINAEYMCSLGKSLKGAGFSTIVANSNGGQDDHTLISRIRQVQFANTAEIIMVSCDRDFVPVLRLKAQQGFKVHWVVSRTPSRSGRPHISADLDKLFSAGEFKFTLVERFRSSLTLPDNAHKQHRR